MKPHKTWKKQKHQYDLRNKFKEEETKKQQEEEAKKQEELLKSPAHNKTLKDLSVSFDTASDLKRNKKKR